MFLRNVAFLGSLGIEIEEAIAIATSSDVHVYDWNTNSFGTKYASVAPENNEFSSASRVQFSTDNRAIIATKSDIVDPLGGGIVAYQWLNGFGTKYTAPVSFPSGGVFGLDLTKEGALLAVGVNASPYIAAYPWSTSTGFGTKFANPTSLPVGTAVGLTFAKTADSTAPRLGYGTTLSPYLRAYTMTDTAFATHIASPDVSPGSSVRDVKSDHPDSTWRQLYAATNSTPYVRAYQWFGGGFIGEVYANPATRPAGSAYDLAVSSPTTDDDIFLAVAHNTSPRVTVYRMDVSSGFQAKASNPTTVPTGNGRGVDFNKNSTALAVTHETAPYITIYEWEPNTLGFGSKISDAATNVGATPTDVNFSN